jgi:hypothetical protein
VASARAALATFRDDGLNVVTLKQGQVELPPTAATEGGFLGDALLVERRELEALNDAVRVRAQEKIQILSEMREFRKKIHVLKWGCEALDARAEEVSEKTKTLQLLRVTKELQQAIKGGDASRRAAEVSTLERQLAHGATIQNVRVEEARRRLARVEKALEDKELENGKLDEYVQDLSVSVAQREKIAQIRGGGGGYAGGC